MPKTKVSLPKYPFCTGLQLEVLRALALHGPLPATELSRHTGLVGGNQHSKLQELVRDGHIHRLDVEGKGYRISYSISPTGLMLVAFARKLDASRKKWRERNNG